MGDNVNVKPAGPRTIFVKKEDPAFTYVSPAATDVLRVLEAKLDAPSFPAREIIEESRADRGRRAVDKGGLNDVPWSLTFRMLGQGTAGLTIAARKALLENAAGLNYHLYASGGVVTVVDYAQGGTDTITVVTIAANGAVTTTVLTEGTDFDAETSNDVTATNIAAAMDALTGVTATATLAVVTYSCDTGYRDIDVDSGDASFATAVDLDNRCFYVANKTDPADTVSITAMDRQTTTSTTDHHLSQVILIGCIVQTIEITGSVTEYPKIKVTGLAARRMEFEATTLAAEIDSVDGLAMTLTDPDRVRTGLGDDSESSLELHWKIEDEVVKETAQVWSTGVCVIARAQKETSGATHVAAKQVVPYIPVPTYQEAGVAIGMSDWTAQLDGSAIRLQSFSLSLATGRAFDDRSSGLAYSDSIHNEALTSEGSIEFTRDLERMEHARKVEAGTNIQNILTLGSTSGSIFGVVCPICLPKNSEGVLEPNKPTKTKIDFDGLDNVSETTTTPGLSGQLQIFTS